MNTKNATDSQLQALIDASPIGIIMINSDGVIKDANPQMCQIFDYKKEELIDKSIELLIPERFRTAHPGHRNSFIANPTVRSMGKNRDLYGLRKDGKEFPVEVGLGPVKSGGHDLAAGFIIDITTRVEAEEKSRRLYQEIQEISIPVLSIWEGVLLMPLIGTLDSYRAQDAMEKALTRMADEKVNTLIVDITGVPVVDTMVANHLIRLALATRLMGGQCILTGISPSIARTIVHLGIDLSALETRSTLAQGLKLAIG